MPCSQGSTARSMQRLCAVDAMAGGCPWVQLVLGCMPSLVLPAKQGCRDLSATVRPDDSREMSQQACHHRFRALAPATGRCSCSMQLGVTTCSSDHTQQQSLPTCRSTWSCPAAQ